ncbi:MAG: hypothetical protein M0Z76_01700 [Gammaproteobacteria bacterium]|nr:hypothetical protein [Gammaproteobacteria bacterium]
MQSTTRALSGWLEGAMGQIAGDWLLWLAVTVIYLAACVVIARLPFVGPVLIALYTPIVIAGILRAPARTAEPLAGRVAAVLWGPLRTAGRPAWPTLFAAAYVLGAWMLTTVLEMFCNLDALSFHALFAYQGGVGDVFVGGELLIFWMLRSAVAITAMMFVAGVALDGLSPQAALEHALRLWVRARRLMLAMAVGVWPALVAAYLPTEALVLAAGLTLVPLVLLVGNGYRGLRDTVAQGVATMA